MGCMPSEGWYARDFEAFPMFSNTVSLFFIAITPYFVRFRKRWR